MDIQEYIVHLDNHLQISGSPESIYELANVYRAAACECGNQINKEMHDKHRDVLISELLQKQLCYENVEKQLIDAIRDSHYYQNYSSKMSNMIDTILEEIKSEEK